MGRARWTPTPRREVVTQPAAGADFSRQNDSGGIWFIRGLALRLVADANVANRFVKITATAGEDVWFITTAQLAHAATITRNYSAWPGSASTTVDSGAAVLGWPTDGLILPPGHVLASQITAIQATDQVSAVVLDIIEYPEVLPSHLMPMPYTFSEDDQE